MVVDVFRSHRYILRALGVTFPGDITNTWLQGFVDVYLALQVSVVLWWGYMFCVGAYLYPTYDFVNRLHSLTAAISVGGAVSKLYIFRTRRDVLFRLFNSLGSFLCHTNRGKTVKKVTSIFEWSVVALIVRHNVHYIWEYPEITRTLPYFAKLKTGPFGEVNRDFWLCLDATMVTCWGNVSGDTMFLLLCSQISHKLLQLINTVQLIGKEDKMIPDENSFKIEGQLTDEIIIKECVKEHNNLINFTRDVEELFNWIVMAQITYSFGAMCITLFVFSQYEDKSMGMGHLAPQFMALFMEIFLYCWGGEMVNTHFEKLHHAIYFCDWYRCKEKDRTSLLIMQSFTVQKVNMTSMSIFHLNFQTYETMCRETFSYYTIMYQLFSEK